MWALSIQNGAIVCCCSSLNVSHVTAYHFRGWTHIRHSFSVTHPLLSYSSFTHTNTQIHKYTHTRARAHTHTVKVLISNLMLYFVVSYETFVAFVQFILSGGLARCYRHKTTHFVKYWLLFTRKRLQQDTVQHITKWAQSSSLPRSQQWKCSGWSLVFTSHW